VNETTDQLMQLRFDAIANHAGEGDWSDVLRRAAVPRVRRAARLRPLAVRFALAAAAALVLVAIAVAFGWPGAIVDFFDAPPAPESVAKFFNTFDEMVPPGMKDGTVGQPREVMTAIFDANHFTPTDPIEHTLYVAPRTDGGFCYLWTEDGGSCAAAEGATTATTTGPDVPHGPGPLSFGVTSLEGDFTTEVDGFVRGDAQTVEARFADGSSVSVPVTWVSAPIDAGFYVYVVPPEHLNTDDPLVSVVALDANGDVFDIQNVSVTKPLDEDVPQTLLDGTKVSLPRVAQVSHAREPFSFRTASGGHAYLWVMPRTGGGTCFVYGTGAGGGEGCASPRQLSQLPTVNGGGALGGVFFAQVNSSVASVELRYANGTGERIAPVDGFVLHELTPGTRLAKAVALSRAGKPIYTDRIPRPGLGH